MAQRWRNIITAERGSDGWNMFRLLRELEENLTEYQSIPFWSWNDKLNPDVLIEQIDWMKKNGIGGFFMHARGGLRTPYMSEEWMQCVDACVEAAKEKGMQAWIYDENGWPSGFAGGKLLEKEENRDAHITHTIGAYDASAWLTYSVAGDELKRITEQTDGECLNLYLHISPSTADILNGEVVDQFIKETHEKYKERYGEAFSNCLTGIFTDEPQYYRWGVAYTRVMPDTYKKQYGEELFDSLGLLFVEKEGYRAFRYRYWYTMQHLMLNNFAKKIYDWCEQHGVQFTGHYVEENTLDGQMSCCAGVMPFYQYMHMPGIDWLNREVGNKLSLRQIASVAQQFGKKQVLSESYGACGWDVTPKELKRFGDYQYVGGINRTCQHLMPYSEHGQRKRDYPAHFSGINPWIQEYFKDFNDYFTRLGYLLANSEEVVDVAMLHPIRSAYFDYKDKDVNERDSIQELERAFHMQLDTLYVDQIPFHFLDETLLEQHGFVKGNRIGCGLREYQYLVIPTCYTMGRHTENLIQKYVENGGKILLLADKPTYLEGEPFDYSYLASNITYEQLKENMPYRLKESVDKVHSTLRQTDIGQFLFVQNYSDETKTVQYILEDGYRSFEKWDLTNMSSSIVSSDVTLEPDESYVLFFSDNEAMPSMEKEIIHLPLEAEVSKATENYLTLDTIKYSKDGIVYSDELPCVGVLQKLLEEHYEGDLYVKYTFRITEKPSWMAVIAEKCGTEELIVNGREMPLTRTWDRQLEFQQGDITGYIHEGENEIIRKLHFYQSEDVYYALFGEGVTETLLNCLSYDTDIEPLYLAGEFGVYAEEITQGQRPGILLGSKFFIGKKTQKIKNLITDGYPFFAGTIHLKRTIVLEKTDVILEFQGRFQAMKVWVNGKEAGSLLYSNKVDISEFTKVGNNEITLELIVSNRNLFGPHHMAKDEEPESVGPYSFELPRTWKEGRSSEYRESYSFVPVPIH